MSYQPGGPATAAPVAGGARVLAVAAAAATFLGAALPFFSQSTDGDQLLSAGTEVAVLYVVLCGLMAVGAVTAVRDSGALALAGGAGLFTFGLNALVIASVWPLVSSSDQFYEIGPGAGMIFTGVGGALGLLVWFTAVGQRPPAGARRTINPGLGAIGALSAIAMTIGISLPPPDLGVSWRDWALAPEGYEYAAQLNLGLACFYAGCAFAIVVGFGSASRWGLGMALGGVIPVGWIAFVAVADIGDGDSGGLSQAFRTELHPVFGIGCAAVVLFVCVGYASGHTVVMPQPITPPRWAPDPFGRFEQRYWDGLSWTDHVSSGGTSMTDPPVAAPLASPEPAAAPAIATPSALWAAAPSTPPAAPPAGPPIVATRTSNPWLAAPTPFDTVDNPHDGMTRPRTEVTTHHGAWSLRLADGTSVPLLGLTVVGREPAAQPGEIASRLVALDDPTYSISKTHLAVDVDSSGVWVTDRHSTNGVTVAGAAGTKRLEPGDRTRIREGDVVSFGDLSFTLTATFVP